MISYVVQPGDNISSIASAFGVQEQAIIDVNNETLYDYDTIFIPVEQLPSLSQPAVAPAAPPGGNGSESGSGRDRTGTVRGLGIGLGLVGLLLVLVSGVWVWREFTMKKRLGVKDEEEDGGRKMVYSGGKEGQKGGLDVKLMANVSDCLDKYRVFTVEELVEATHGFDGKSLIEGSVYRGEIDGELFAIKKMKWNAYEELKILQKVTTHATTLSSLVLLSHSSITSLINCFFFIWV